MRGRWPEGPEGASWTHAALAPSVAPRQLPRIAGEHLPYFPATVRLLAASVTSAVDEIFRDDAPRDTS